MPAAGREKVFFTTNLAKRLPKETFHELSQANIHHINISLESLNPLVYEDLRRGARFDTFMLNLEDLVTVFRKYPKSPSIRYITMVFKQNLNELVDLVSVCHDRFLAEQHELRAPFNISLSHLDEEWIGESIISRKEWDELETLFSGVPFRPKFKVPSVLDEPNGDQSLNPFPDPRIPSVYTVIPKLCIRINSDGTVFLPWNKKKWYVYNINEIDNPYMFFKRKLYRIYDMATWTRWAHAFRRYTRVRRGLSSAAAQR
jgi:MoaA/NifB/PqqE/SkfB family radical SAM enzyme